MDFRLGHKSDEFRQEVREFLAATVTPEMLERVHDSGTLHDWELHRALAAKGWLAASWPVGGRAPTFAVEGRAWMAAAREVCPSWSEQIELAWQRAWLLLSEELALESLSPFAADAPPSR